MLRIAGVDLQDGWKVDYALTVIKGVGWPTARKIMQQTKVATEKRVSQLSNDEVARLTEALEKYAVEGDWLREVRGSISRLRGIASYRGLRHARGLPVRGQRTRSNARTKRGKRKTVGAFKKEALAKQTTGGTGK